LPDPSAETCEVTAPSPDRVSGRPPGDDPARAASVREATGSAGRRGGGSNRAPRPRASASGPDRRGGPPARRSGVRRSSSVLAPSGSPVPDVVLLISLGGVEVLEDIVVIRQEDALVPDEGVRPGPPIENVGD